MVQAAVEGVVDFSQTRLTNKWLRRLDLMLQGLQKRNERQRAIVDLTTPLWSLMIASPSGDRAYRMGADVFDRASTKLLNSYKLGPAPSDVTEHERLKTMAQQAVKDWETTYGAMNSPETKRKEAAFVKAMTALMAQTAKNATAAPHAPLRVQRGQLQKAVQLRSQSSPIKQGR